MVAPSLKTNIRWACAAETLGFGAAEQSWKSAAGPTRNAVRVNTSLDHKHLRRDASPIRNAVRANTGLDHKHVRVLGLPESSTDRCSGFIPIICATMSGICF